MVYVVLALVLSTIFFCTNRRYRWIYILYKTIGRDFRGLLGFVKLNYTLRKHQHSKDTPSKIFTKLVAQHPHKIAIYFEDELWTLEDIEKYSNKVANYFKSRGFKRGDIVALFLENRPEYLGCWLGLSKIGIVSALINTNLVNDPLLHCIQVADSKAVVYGASLRKAIQGIAGKLSATQLYQLPEKKDIFDLLDNATDLATELEKQPGISPKEDIENGQPTDKFAFIYTSGTTGLPKPAVITNMRYLFMGLAFHIMLAMKEDEIIYDPLPLYHTAGGVVGLGQCLLKGTTVVIRKKFSASSFWKDCVRYKCTCAQYIGEICRYILIAHSNVQAPIEHSVTKIVGNGLRPLIWKQFVEKFNIKQVYEFYGATEGNSNLINLDSKLGSVGYLPRYASSIYPVTLIRCDETTGEPIRGKDGFCQSCRPDQAGILLGVVNPKKVINAFTGYADKQETKKKLLRDVFKKGDVYFNSGDVLVQDEFGYFYFKDRTGDTFRWKGENVATCEIEAVISSVVNLNDAIVYGVEIPNVEGRAGMAAILDTCNALDMDRLCKGLKNNLPSYAIPLFVRVLNTVPLTGTFKLKKTDLKNEAFDINQIKDKLFLYDAKNVTYVELTRDRYNDIMNGTHRL